MASAHGGAGRADDDKVIQVVENVFDSTIPYAPLQGVGHGIEDLTAATCLTVGYVNEHRSGSMLSLTLYDGGYERSVINLHFPVLWLLGITPNRITWSGGNWVTTEGGKGPSHATQSTLVGEVSWHNLRVLQSGHHVTRGRPQQGIVMKPDPEPLCHAP